MSHCQSFEQQQNPPFHPPLQGGKHRRFKRIWTTTIPPFSSQTQQMGNRKLRKSISRSKTCNLLSNRPTCKAVNRKMCRSFPILLRKARSIKRWAIIAWQKPRATWTGRKTISWTAPYSKKTQQCLTWLWVWRSLMTSNAWSNSLHR